MTAITTTVEFILWPKEGHSGGFIIFRSAGEIAKGSIPWAVSVGDILRLEGELRKDPKQPHRPPAFFFSSAMPDLPVCPRARLSYAASITKGLGAAKEEAIWNAYGAAWEESGRLEKITGLRQSARDNWTLTLERINEEAHKTTVISWLASMGATLKLAGAAWARWGSNTQGVVNADPFKLAELPGWGFAAIDQTIRVAMGIADDDMRRLSAALTYVVKRETKSTGSTLVDKPTAQLQMVSIVGDYDIDSIINASNDVIDMDGDLALAVDVEIEQRIYARLIA